MKEYQKVSVIIPTYKRGEILKRAIDSVLNQTYRNIEVFVVDDNNPDSSERAITQTIMNKYTDNGKINYIKHNRNRNGAAARNTGIKMATGEFITFLDDDDYYHEEKVSKEVEFLVKNTEYAGVYCGSKQNGQDIIPFQYGDLSKQILLQDTQLATSTLMFRKECFKYIVGFDETFIRHQDYELMLRFFEKYQIGVVSEMLVYRGKNEGENVPTGKDLERIKQKFLDTFDSKISRFGNSFRKEVYSKHYSVMFASHLKHHFWKMMFNVMFYSLLHFPFLFLKNLFSRFDDYKKNKKHVKQSIGFNNYS